MLTHLPSHRRLRLLATFLLLPALLVTAQASASAVDYGGDGSPAASCSGGYTAASAPLVGTQGANAGKVIGQVELRWSWACHGNWSRVLLYGGTYSDVYVDQEVRSEGRIAWALDTVVPGSAGASAYSPFLRLANSQSPACAQAWVSSYFGTSTYHTITAQVCA